MSLPVGRGGGLIKSIRNQIPTRTGRRRANRFRDGTKFGPKKMFIASSFDLEKWANRRGYGVEHLDKLQKSGVLEKILQGGAKGAQWHWYDNTTGWDRLTTTRVGAIATKVGMKMEQDYWGRSHPVTLLQLKDNQVVQVKTEETDGYTAIQVGAGLKKLKQLTKPMMGHFARADVAPKQKLVEFKVSKNAMIPVGTKIFAEHFRPGQFIDVRGKTRGKGFAGAMKRWGFAGLNASHGVSTTHRSLGATGQRQDPGRTFRGKKMHGHMGDEFRTVRNLRIMKIDTKMQILYVMGKVPGAKKSWIVVRDAAWKKPTTPPPFPTFWRKPGLVLPRFLHWRFADPYAETREIDWEQKISEMVAALKAAQAAGEGEESGDAAAAGGSDGGNLFGDSAKK